MTPTIYYTIIPHRTFSLVKYATTPSCQIMTFPGTFDSPLEASQEFKQTVQGKLSYLTPGAFEHKVSTLQANYQQDMARLTDWNNGKAIRL